MILEAIREAIKKHCQEGYAEFKGWILKRDWELWDRQIERDASAGTPEKLFERALQSHRQGQSCML